MGDGSVEWKKEGARALLFGKCRVHLQIGRRGVAAIEKDIVGACASILVPET